MISSVDVRPAQAGLARICGVSRSAIWYRVQRGHLRPDENGLLDVSIAIQALQRRRSRIIIPYNERDHFEIEKLKLQIKPVPIIYFSSRFLRHHKLNFNPSKVTAFKFVLLI